MKNLYEKETTWGVHSVTQGRGKYAGKFIYESRGWGGARGTFRVFDTLEEAIEAVDRATATISLSKEERVRF